MNPLSRLRQTARAQGIQTSFIDNSGQERFASDETLRLLLERLGVDEDQPDESPVDPVLVSWQKSKGLLKTTVRVKPRKIELLAEGGKPVLMRNYKVLELGPNRFGLELPISDLPSGYHQIVYQLPGGEQTALLISARRKLYASPSRRWGAFLPLYAAHSAQSWGAGNLTDWRDLARWVGYCGGEVVGTLPILAAFLAYPKCEPSPYSPASRLFWNEFFIDVTAAPEFNQSRRATKLTGSATFQKTLQRFRKNELIDYPEQWRARRQVLEILAEEFFERRSTRLADFESYRRAHPQLEEYARFRAACDQARTSWHSWREGARNGTIQSSDFDERTRDFYLYIQWMAQEQVDEALHSCREAGVNFYLDLPLGVNPDGFDAWRYRDFLARQVSAGAPPDAFFTKGQDWGFAPLDPRRTRRLKYQYVIDYLSFQMRHTGLLRIDHVMGLHRLWWVPHGRPASEGAYVRYAADELYAILSVESHRHKTTLVGENLGTVPPEVNKSMDRHGLRRMYVVQYEQPVDGPLREPEPQVVASINTHDMPMFAAHWKSLDIADRADLGLIPKKELAGARQQRAAMRRNLVAFLQKENLLPRKPATARKVLDAILAYLARSPAETVLVNLEDLWGETRSQNVPGTSSERPNWQRKSARALEDLFSDQGLANRLRDILRR